MYDSQLLKKASASSEQSDVCMAVCEHKGCWREDVTVFRTLLCKIHHIFAAHAV
jgi:hypothetical protein